MMTFTIYGQPVAKPRMTRRDKWKQRECVLHYRAWCDLARLVAFGNPLKKTMLSKPTVLNARFYFASGKQHRTGPHIVKPDFDNCSKALADALFHNDQMIYKSHIEKYWCDGGPPRVEVDIA